MLGLLQALPNTALWERLKKEERLMDSIDNSTGDQNTLMNFVPTRPVTDIAREYVEGFWTLYEPSNYLRRCIEQCLKILTVQGRGQTMQFPLGRGFGTRACAAPSCGASFGQFCGTSPSC
jgi:radical SAM superfamily enzyme YgiQ (UPF0313 family)